jgi:hypothetical protein
MNQKRDEYRYRRSWEAIHRKPMPRGQSPCKERIKSYIASITDYLEQDFASKILKMENASVRSDENQLSEAISLLEETRDEIRQVKELLEEYITHLRIPATNSNAALFVPSPHLLTQVAGVQSQIETFMQQMSDSGITAEQADSPMLPTLAPDEPQAPSPRLRTLLRTRAYFPSPSRYELQQGIETIESLEDWTDVDTIAQPLSRLTPTYEEVAIPSESQLGHPPGVEEVNIPEQMDLQEFYTLYPEWLVGYTNPSEYCT